MCAGFVTARDEQGGRYRNPSHRFCCVGGLEYHRFVPGGADQHKVVEHDFAILRRRRFLQKCGLADRVVCQREVGVTAPQQLQGTAAPNGKHLHVDSAPLMKGRKNRL
jgi:hypothetical protein